MSTLMVRQPLFDAALEVAGYEILHRELQGGPDRVLREAGDGGASIVDLVVGEGLQRIAGDGVAFLAVDETTLRSGILELLPPEQVVIELQESVRCSDATVAACESLAHAGFRLATHYSAPSPLRALAQIGTMDVAVLGPEATRGWAEELARSGMTLLARGIEDGETHQRCLELGFHLFQGFHFLKPRDLSPRDLSTESVTLLRLLSLLRDEDATDAMIVEAFRSDPTLSYKFLRMINSAGLGGRGVDSLDHALRLLGRDPLYRWLSLLLVRSQGAESGPRSELVRTSLIRARMCELIGEAPGLSFIHTLPDSGSLFLVGLLSLIDQLFGESLDQILDRIDLRPSTREALLQRAGPAGTILNAVEAYEEAEWERAEELVREVGADPSALSNQYLDALAWARGRMGIHEG